MKVDLISVCFMISLIALGCHKAAKKYPDKTSVPPVPTSSEGFQLLEEKLAACRSEAPDGTVVIHSLFDRKAPKALCLGVLASTGEVWTSRFCQLPPGDDLVGLSLSRNGQWLTSALATQKVLPYTSVHGWIAAPGSLDLLRLSPKTNWDGDALKLAIRKKGVSASFHDAKLLHLKGSDSRGCPELSPLAFESMPYIVPFGVPLKPKADAEEELSPEIFLGARPLGCDQTTVGSLLMLREHVGRGEFEFAGILSRHYRPNAEVRCEERGDEIFTSLHTVTAVIQAGDKS